MTCPRAGPAPDAGRPPRERGAWPLSTHRPEQIDRGSHRTAWPVLVTSERQLDAVARLGRDALAHHDHVALDDVVVAVDRIGRRQRVALVVLDRRRRR